MYVKCIFLCLYVCMYSWFDLGEDDQGIQLEEKLLQIKKKNRIKIIDQKLLCNGLIK